MRISGKDVYVSIMMFLIYMILLTLTVPVTAVDAL